MPQDRSKNVEISIRLLARTVVDRGQVRSWLDEMGADKFEIPSQESATDAALLVALAAKQCYMSFQPSLNPNVTKIRADLCEYLDNVMASGHGSVLEHASYTFGINGISRVFTGEMNRHRAGWAISERSMRFIRFEECISWWLPLSITENPNDDPDLARKKAATRDIFHDVFEYQSKAYSELISIWDMNSTDKNFHYKKVVTSCLRRIIGMGVATGGVWTGNVRALRHVLTMRASQAAEEEICHVFSRIAAEISKTEPMLFGDFQQDEQGFWRPRYNKI